MNKKTLFDISNLRSPGGQLKCPECKRECRTLFRLNGERLVCVVCASRAIKGTGATNPPAA